MTLKPPHGLSRRDVLKLFWKGSGVASLGLLFQACAPKTDPQVETLQTEVNELTNQLAKLQAGQSPVDNTQGKIARGDKILSGGQENSVLATPDLTQSLEQQGIRVELPNPNWPTSYEAVAEVLNRPGSSNVVTADRVVAVVERTASGPVWRGWFMAEPPFPLKPGIEYKPDLGYHVRTTDNQPVFNPTEIFETGWNKLPEDLRNNFASYLADLRLNRSDVAVFARTGGVARADGSPPHTHHFLGTAGVEILGIEQLSLIPVPADLCPDDIEKAATTRAFRQATLEFRDNPDAQEGRISVKWFNPETGSFQLLDGRMISFLAKQGRNLAMLDALPAGAPLSPEDLASTIGGRPENWLVVPHTWEWFYEAFKLQSGVNYVTGVGHVDSNGSLLVGVEQTSRETSRVFDFSHLDPTALVDFMSAPRNLPVVLFARVGEYPNNPEINNHSYYTWGNGDVQVGQPAIEQATWMIHDTDGCPVVDMPNALTGRAKALALERRDPNKIKAYYWDGSTFIQV